MKSAELKQAAQQIKASQHPAATQIADLLDHAATELAHAENNWTLCQYTATVQTDLTRWLYGRHIAIAQALTGDQATP